MADVEITQEHKELFHQIGELCSNHDLHDAANALLNALATVIAQIGGTLEECEALVDKSIPSMKKNIRDNWELVESIHGRRDVSGNA